MAFFILNCFLMTNNAVGCGCTVHIHRREPNIYDTVAADYVYWSQFPQHSTILMICDMWRGTLCDRQKSANDTSLVDKHYGLNISWNVSCGVVEWEWLCDVCVCVFCVCIPLGRPPRRHITVDEKTFIKLHQIRAHCLIIKAFSLLVKKVSLTRWTHANN